MSRVRSGSLIAILCLVISAPAFAQVGSLWTNGNLGPLLVVADFSPNPGLECITVTLMEGDVVMATLDSGNQIAQLPAPFNDRLYTTFQARDFDGDGLAEILCLQRHPDDPYNGVLTGLLELNSGGDDLLRVWPDIQINTATVYVGDIKLSAAEPNAMVLSGRGLVIFSPGSGAILYDSFADPDLGPDWRLDSFIIDDFNGDGNEEILGSFISGDLSGSSYRTTLIGDTAVSSAEDFESTFGIMMSSGRPNPTSGPNHIAYELPKGSHVSLKVYDIAGRHVRTVIDTQMAAGEHQAFWDGRDKEGRSVASGTYFYELKAEGQRLTQKVLQIR